MIYTERFLECRFKNNKEVERCRGRSKHLGPNGLNWITKLFPADGTCLVEYGSVGATTLAWTQSFTARQLLPQQRSRCTANQALTIRPAQERL
ncbi:hypothetical protein CYMTET_17102 [Cymbomonas tetramitiformis]|uniref:Uncharacterized protein n=1 Tax=Cymbomonas tetramitiformis TaxID=36881 RepID=A0AAE0GAY7_9CHLO|nr:hypothetical protein CYMTET_17102 [Cymbomonas tetramitiformis]